MTILIRWLLQNPADVDLQCFPKKGTNLGSAGQGLRWIHGMDENGVDHDQLASDEAGWS